MKLKKQPNKKIAKNKLATLFTIAAISISTLFLSSCTEKTNYKAMTKENIKYTYFIDSLGTANNELVITIKDIKDKKTNMENTIIATNITQKELLNNLYSIKKETVEIIATNDTLKILIRDLIAKQQNFNGEENGSYIPLLLLILGTGIGLPTVGFILKKGRKKITSDASDNIKIGAIERYTGLDRGISKTMFKAGGKNFLKWFGGNQ